MPIEEESDEGLGEETRRHGAAEISDQYEDEEEEEEDETVKSKSQKEVGSSVMEWFKLVGPWDMGYVTVIN